jgi:hypothetical protein
MDVQQLSYALRELNLTELNIRLRRGKGQKWKNSEDNRIKSDPVKSIKNDHCKSDNCVPVKSKQCDSSKSDSNCASQKGVTKASLSETELNAKLSQSSSESITIITAEGDKVTISSSSATQVQLSAYDRSGQICQDGNCVSVKERGVSLSATSAQSYSFSVEGDLNAEELKDIESAVLSFRKVQEKNISGNTSSDPAKEMDFSRFQTLQAFQGLASYNRSLEVSASQKSASLEYAKLAASYL